MLVTGAEGHGVAKWLNEHGITGIVLEYELPRGRSQVPLADAQRALRTARAITGASLSVGMTTDTRSGIAPA